MSWVAHPEKVNVSRLPRAVGSGGASLPLLVADSTAYASAKKSPNTRPGFAIGQPGQALSGAGIKGSVQALSFNHDFAGIASAQDQGVIAAQVEPPDTQIAVSPTRVLEMVNTAGQIYDKSGVAQSMVFPLDPFFLLNSGTVGNQSGGWAGFFFGGEHLIGTDPRILYDSATGRFYSTILAYGPTTFDSVTLLAISDTGDPGGFWTIYVMDVEGPSPQFTPAICDQPKLGYSSDKFVIGCNLFNFSKQFGGALLMVATKAPGLIGANMTETEFVNTQVFGPNGAANMTAGVATAYLTFNENDNTTPVAAVGVTTYTGTVTGIFNTDVAKLATHDIAMNATSAPPSAPQLGLTTNIDTGDDRFNSAFVQGGALYTAGGESCTPSGDTAPRACLRLVEVNASTFTLIQGATAGKVGTNLINPTLGITSSGDVVFEYSTSSATTDPDVEVAVQPVGDVNTFVDGGIMVGSTTAYHGIAGTVFRWGDYGAVAVDPSAPAYDYVAGEFSSTGTTPTNWGTQIGEILGHIPQVCTANPLLPSVMSPQKPSVDITLTATATCLSPAMPDFQFWIKAPGGALTMVQNYGNGNTYDWAPGTHVTLGTYTLEVLVRGVTETARAWDSFSVISYVISATPCAMPTLHADLTPPQIAGTTVNLTASTGDCPDTTELYQFWVRTPDLVFHPLGAYSATNTAAWNTFNTQIGSYLVEVLIKNTGSTAAFDNFASIPYSMQLCNAPTLSTGTATSPYVSGSGPITLTATGACMGGAQFAFFYEDPANVFHTIQAYSPTATAMWNADFKAGTYRLLVETKPTGSTAAFVSYHFLSPDFTLSGCGMPSLQPDSNSPQIGGTTVTWTSNVTCSGTANFSFWVRSPAGVWSNPQPYGPTNTFPWKAPSTLGTYLVEVLVRNQGANEDLFDSFNSFNFVIGLCNAPTLSTGTATSPYVSGSGPITLTATGACMGGAQFAFFYEDPANVFHTIQAYSPTATAMWNADFKAGTYRLLVETKPTGSTATFVSYHFLSPDFTLSGCGMPSLQPDSTSPQIGGTTVTWTSNVTCSGTANFSFWVRSPAGVWSNPQPYGPTNTFPWKAPSTLGTYLVEVLVRNQGANEDLFDSFNSFNFAIGLCSTPTLVPGAASPYASGAGPITLTATGSCTGGTQFAYFYEDSANVFHVIQPYSTNTMASWNADYKAGAYKLLVETKPTGSTAAFVSYFFVPNPFTLSGCTLPNLGPDKPSPQPPNTQVVFTASATCTGASAQFQFWVVSPTGVFTKVQDYGNANGATFTWTTPTTPGVYTIEVLIRNVNANEDPWDTYTTFKYTVT